MNLRDLSEQLTQMVIIMDERSTLEAIAFFEDMKERQTKWYMSHDKVSLQMMSEYEAFLTRCKWAIDRLKDNLK